MAELNSLLEKALRKDPKKAAAQEKARHSAEVEHFLKSRAAQAAVGGGGFNMGLLDILSAMPATQAAKLLKTGNLGGAAVNALAFTSQFDDSKMAQDVGDALALFPVFGGVGSLGNLRRTAARSARTGKDLPQFSYEGKIAPRRQAELEKRMRDWIPNASAANKEDLTQKLDTWVKNNPFWGKYPLEKGPLLDLMPKELRAPFYQSLKEMGYGGTKMGERGARDLKGKLLGNRPRLEGKKEIESFANRKWEEIMPFEQSGGVPKGWAEKNPGRQPEWVTRPGEKLKPGQKGLLDSDLYQQAGQQWAGGALLGGGISAAQSLAGGGQGQKGGDQKAGLVVNRRNIGRLRQMQQEKLMELSKKRPGMADFNAAEATFAAKYPKLYKNAVDNSEIGAFQPIPGSYKTGEYNPATGNIGIGVPRDPKQWDETTLFGKRKVSPEVFNSMGHESIHANDFNRLGKINDPATGRKMDVGDLFAPDDVKDKDFMMKTLSRMSKKYPDLEKMFDNFDPKYISPPSSSKRRNPLQALEDWKQFRQYKKQPLEARAFKAGATSGKSVEKLFEALGNDKLGAIGGLGAALVGGAATSRSSDDDQAVVGRLTKLRRKIALANNPAAFLDKPLDGIALPKPYADKYRVTRAQNTDMVLPEQGNRRGGNYVIAEPIDRPFQGNSNKPSYHFQYQNDNPTTTAEGGRNVINNYAEPKNPFRVPVSTFFGNHVEKVIPSGHAKGRSPELARFDKKNPNQFLPKHLKLNNVDIRKMGKDAVSGLPGVGTDAFGDYLLNKYAKHYGYDSVVPRAFQKKAKAGHEMMLPNESRWDKKPATVASMETMLGALDKDFTSLKGFIPNKKGTVVNTSKSQVDEDVSTLLQNADAALKAKQPARVPDWYVKEAHEKYKKAISSPGGPINSFSERKKFVDDYLKKYDPEIPF